MVASVLFNLGSQVALQNLQATQTNLLQTQSEISTGLKVQTAKDNAATWSIATQMNSDVNNLQAVSNGLGDADSALGLAVSGASQIASLITQIRGKVTDAQAAGANTTDIQNDIKALVSQIDATVSASSYNGVNLLDKSHDDGTNVDAGNTGSASGTALSIVSSVTTGGTSTASTITQEGTDLTVGSTATPGTNSVMAALGSIDVTAAGGYQTDLTSLDAASQFVNDTAASLGSTQSRVEMQQTFVNNLVSTLQGSVSNMVDADMSAESARLSALQTQQSLGTQALSIANQSSSSILQLFR